MSELLLIMPDKVNLYDFRRRKMLSLMPGRTLGEWSHIETEEGKKGGFKVRVPDAGTYYGVTELVWLGDCSQIPLVTGPGKMKQWSYEEYGDLIL